MRMLLLCGVQAVFAALRETPMKIRACVHLPFRRSRSVDGTAGRIASSPTATVVHDMNKRIQHTTLAAAALSLLLAGGTALAADNDPPADNTLGDSDQPVGDTWITTKVKTSLLADEDVAGLKIDVETVNGVVTLKGNVASQAQIDEARRIASGIEGVVDVDSDGLSVDATE